MSDWQPISTAPKDGTTILVVFDGKLVVAKYVECSSPWKWAEWDEEKGSFNERWVTHWMPIPAPPTKPKDAP